MDNEDIHSLCLIPATDGGLYDCGESEVFYRNNSTDWQLNNTGLPGHFNSNIGRPFFRDSKIRIASYGKGIWEAELEEAPSYPIAQIMVDNLEQTVECEIDSFYFSDYSIVNHNGATWQWEFTNGIPNTSNELKPIVNFDTPGTHYEEYLTFDVAYARYAVNYADSLEVLASIGCQGIYESLYFKGSNDLATVDETNEDNWTPESNEWRTDSIDITNYIGEEKCSVCL